jgi:hypothetical protein
MLCGSEKKNATFKEKHEEESETIVVFDAMANLRFSLPKRRFARLAWRIRPWMCPGEVNGEMKKVKSIMQMSHSDRQPRNLLSIA